MKSLYLVRHGHTLWSEAGRVAGKSEIALSNKGLEAIESLAHSASCDLAITHWFSSPMQRTTASSQRLRLGLRDNKSITLPETVYDSRLVELDFGEWEGLLWQEVYRDYADYMAVWGNDWVNRAPPGGETFAQLHERCSFWLADWLADVSAKDTASAMVVAHGGSVRALICQCLGWPLNRAMSMNIDPASVCCLQTVNSGQWLVRSINSVSF